MSLTDQMGFSFRPPERRVWKVRDLVASVRSHIEHEYSDARVEGEISNFRAPDSGHLYFTLKDGNAQIRVVMFRSSARLLRFRPADGLQVIVRGRVTVYEDRGELQISAEHIEPKGAGSLQLAFEQLKAKLEAEGLFAPERRKPIPTLPSRIGLVTSAQAAALRDILNVLLRRHHSVNVLIYPAQVQGDAASHEVAAGIRFFNQHDNVDVIIVARGGGSAEDLAAFNDEALARTIAASEIPVISAVGHETDFTIVDFVADLRAPTPSAAAELVIRSRQEVEDHAAALHERLSRAMRYRLLMGRQALTELAQYDLRLVLSGMRRHLDSGTAALVAVMRNVLLQYRVRSERFQTALESLSPLAILDRGYALVFDSEGKLLKDARGLNVGDEISARLAHGEIRAAVTKKQEKAFAP
jgi:exodeoxyribonuclease VII large subunit